MPREVYVAPATGLKGKNPFSAKVKRRDLKAQRGGAEPALLSL
jgi:hypothetical protein